MSVDRSAGSGMELQLGSFADAVAARLDRWQQEDFGARLWRQDPTLWEPAGTPEITDRLGWLALPESMRAELERLAAFAAEVKGDGFHDAVVLGMGGSSLAPEVFSEVFGSASGSPRVRVLDSTHPVAVRAMLRAINPARSVFLVSSKSGTTTEPLSFFFTAWGQLGEGGDRGRHFAAITDPGTPLVRLGEQRSFRAIFPAPPDVGGRYSALTPFGLVPAALLGVDLPGMLERARRMASACGPSVPAADNPGLRLGAALGELTLAGRDKVTFVASSKLAPFPDWLEQLIAESTGKIGRGIVPVVGESLAPPQTYGADRFFVALRLAGESDELAAQLAELVAAGHPVAHIVLDDVADLGAEMFRWEVAVAAASAVIGVHPFNQPDVQLAKELASKAMKEAGDSHSTPDPRATPATDTARLGAAIEDWLEGVTRGAYLGIQAYLAPGTLDAGLRRIQQRLRDRTRLATTFGYGPRFLHSTGQLHKGGPANCRFLQIIDTPGEDLAVPETNYTFARLIRAQADGDRQALEQRGRRVLRIDLERGGSHGLETLAFALEHASLGTASAP